MFATVVNMLTVLVGSCVGLALRGKFSEELGNAIMKGIGLANLGMGMASLLGTADFMGVIICMVVGTLIGEKANIERAMDRFGDLLRRKLVKGEGNSRFVEGFVNATVLFCVGAMAINGSIAAGIEGDYSILLTKSVMDGVSSITFAAAMGPGVLCAVIPILVYQGGLTLLAGVVGPYLSAAVITEMSAVGGAIIIGIGLNLLELGREHIRVSNMLPAIFLPILYVPLSAFLTGLF